MLISKYRTEDIDMEKTVSEFEEKHHLNLPDSYRGFLIRYNGGDTPETKFKSGKVSSDVRYFYGIGNVAYSTQKIVDLNDLVSKQILPIARDSFGNYIALCLSADSFGSVVFCDHEKGYKVTEIASSFNEFVAICKSKKIKPVRTIEERERDLIANGFGDMLDDELRRCWQEEIDLYGNIHQEKVVLD